MADLFLHIMTSEMVDILLLLWYKTFCNNLQDNEEVAVGFYHFQSLHKSESISTTNAQTLRLTPKQKLWLVPTWNLCHIISSTEQEKLLWLQTPSICKIAISE